LILRLADPSSEPRPSKDVLAVLVRIDKDWAWSTHSEKARKVWARWEANRTHGNSRLADKWLARLAEARRANPRPLGGLLKAPRGS
jgi:hypothetical protein